MAKPFLRLLTAVTVSIQRSARFYHALLIRDRADGSRTPGAIHSNRQGLWRLMISCKRNSISSENLQFASPGALKNLGDDDIVLRTHFKVKTSDRFRLKTIISIPKPRVLPWSVVQERFRRLQDLLPVEELAKFFKVTRDRSYKYKKKINETIHLFRKWKWKVTLWRHQKDG